MTRRERTLYHAYIEYARNGSGYILDDSHSYDTTDVVDVMMAYAKRRFQAYNNYICDFDANKLQYTITKFGQVFATIKVRSYGDGIELYA